MFSLQSCGQSAAYGTGYSGYEDSLVVGWRAAVGYEFRIKRNFGLNIEYFAGAVHGVDDDDQNMNIANWGLAVGLTN